MNAHPFKYVFGPAFSRRLGRSLGVDLVPFKTCTYDCVYCQLGRTTVCTAERREYVPVDGILKEIARKLETGIEADYITLAGSGEPTLHSGIGDIIAGIKALETPVRRVPPVAVLTNGSLFWMDEVRDALKQADLIVPSLDAGTPESFLQVNQPVSSVTFEKMIEGLVAFRDEFAGQIWLEVFLLGGMTDSRQELEHLAALIQRIRPDKVQLNTVERPAPRRPAPGGHVTPVSGEKMREMAVDLGRLTACHTEVVARQETPSRHQGPGSSGLITAEDALALLQRHPCTAQNLADGLGLPVSEAEAHIAELIAQGKVEASCLDGVTSYVAKTPPR